MPRCMLRDAILRRWAYTPAIHAATLVDHEKRVKTLYRKLWVKYKSLYRNLEMTLKSFNGNLSNKEYQTFNGDIYSHPRECKRDLSKF